MKKAMACAATAVLLGFAIMMIPLAIKTEPLGQQFTNTPTESKGNFLSRSYGLSRQPSNLLPSSLICFSGLILALTVYAVLRRRIP